MNIDWQLLWHMGGQGPYVWGSYGLAVALLVVEAISLWRAGKRGSVSHHAPMRMDNETEATQHRRAA